LADAEKNPSRWGKLPDRTKVERRERQESRFSILSNIVTLLLTCVIIVGGFLLPTLLYPYLSLYHDDLVQLPEPASGTPTFTGPIVLHPWNLYDEENLQPLNYAMRELLEIRGVPQWLLAVMKDCGMETPEDDSVYHSLIVDSFYYLELHDSAEPGYYYLVDFDLNGDGIPDFRCAVDSYGNLVSFVFSSNAFDSTNIQSPVGMPLPEASVDKENGNSALTPGTDSQDTDGATQGGTSPGDPGAGQANQGQDGNVNGNNTVADNPENNPNNPPEKNPNNPTENNPNNPPEKNPALGRPPSPDDLNIWSFAYVVSREAQLVRQTTLFRIFRQIDFVYETRYSYPFTMLFPVQSPDEEDLPEIEYISLEMQTLKSDQYLFHIYYFPSGEILVLYLHPATLKCMGFSLLL